MQGVNALDFLRATISLPSRRKRSWRFAASHCHEPYREAEQHLDAAREGWAVTTRCETDDRVDP